jgi:flagellar hook-basal body complex protein FliE
MISDLYIPSVSVGEWQAAGAAGAHVAKAAAGAVGDIANAVGGAVGDVAGAAAGTTTSPFAGVLQSMMQETGSLQDQATQATKGLLSGSGVEVQDAMVAGQKADLAFELAMQVRNKAVNAYQQMMGMQF